MLHDLEQERGELSQIEQQVAAKAAQHIVIAAHVDEEFREQITAGQRMADVVARVGGSWPFVLGFFVFLMIWMAVNSLLLARHALDPFPYILLNLMLSCLAAIQAPIIMMSQGRLAARDRLQADLDFQTNLKAEIEVATLHDKLDHLLHEQFARMVELQEMQLDLLSELSERR